MTPVKVLYIGGYGRSGSTLVERICGQMAGFVSAGEIVFAWERGLVGDERCGCGAAFSACDFWTRVGKTAFGGWDQVDASEVLAAKRAIDRNRHIPAMLAPDRFPGARERIDRYGAHLARLYPAIAEVAGARVVIDASKHASTAFLLRRVPGIDLRVVHLVRDPRGVAWSWTKEVVKPEVDGGDAYMPVYSPLSSGRQWLAYNAMFEAMGHRNGGRLVLRYEDFLADPAGSLGRICAFAGEDVPADGFGFLADGAVTLGTDHTVAGNPMRFSTGRLALRIDEAWRTKLPRRDQRIVAAVTTPLRLRYRY